MHTAIFLTVFKCKLRPPLWFLASLDPRGKGVYGMLADSDFRSSLASWKKKSLCKHQFTALRLHTCEHLRRLLSAMIHYPAQTGEMLVIDFLRYDPNWVKWKELICHHQSGHFSQIDDTNGKDARGERENVRFHCHDWLSKCHKFQQRRGEEMLGAPYLFYHGGSFIISQWRGGERWGRAPALITCPLPV